MTISLQALSNGSAKILVNGADRLIIEADGTLRGVATPPQFDADNSLATTSFVQRALGNFATSDTYPAAVNLSASDAGKFINLAGSGGQTAQLPSLASVPNGATFTFKSTSSGTWVISRNGSDTITSSGSLFPNFALGSGESVTVTKATSGSSYWYISGECGEVFRNAANLFGSSLTGNGWQRLPSGLIIQWGNSAATTTQSSVVFPITFPVGVRSIYTTDATNAVSAPVSKTHWQIGNPTASGFVAINVGAMNQGSSGAAPSWIAPVMSGCPWFAIGC